MAKYICVECGYVYDEEQGDADLSIKKGAKFEKLPDDFTCPVCGVGKDMFEKLNEEAEGIDFKNDYIG